MKLRKPLARRANDPWSYESERRLRELVERPDMIPYHEIAQKISAEFGVSVTANACIGKAHRLRLPRRDKPEATRAALWFRPIAEPEPEPAPLANDNDLEELPEAARMVLPWTPPRPQKRVRGALTIYQLRDCDCRWPVSGRHAPFLFCGEPAMVPGKPYCPAHTQQSSGRWVGDVKNVKAWT